MEKQTTSLHKVTLAFLLSFFISFSGIIPVKASSGTSAAVETDTPYRAESFPLSGGGSLDVKTSGGHITVEGTSSNTVRVEMYVRRKGRDLTPDEIHLDDWEIDISKSGKSIKAMAKYKGKRWNFFGNGDHPSISFIVYTPRTMSSKLNTDGGHITIKGLSGDQQMRTSGGHLVLSDLEGNIEARTSGGHITAGDLQGNFNARTSGGHIDLNNIRGVVEAQTSGGNIEADFISLASSTDLKTSGGNIDITLPRKEGANLNLKGSYVHSKLTNFSGDSKRNEITGTINGGGPLVSARTSGGLVVLAFQ